MQAHTDGCFLSFNVLLNAPCKFEGGGTLFTDKQELVTLKQGEMLLHFSKREHAGVEITSGKRMLLVGFIETRRQQLESNQVYIPKLIYC